MIDLDCDTEIISPAHSRHDEYLPTNCPIPRVSAVRSQPVCEQSYGGAAGYLYSAKSYLRTIKASRTVALYLSLNDHPLEFELKGSRMVTNAVLFKPMVRRRVDDFGYGFVSAVLNPSHPYYRHFSIASFGDALPLERDRFSRWNETIRDAHLGSLSLSEGLELLADIVAKAVEGLPAPKPLDERISFVTTTLRNDRLQSLEELASNVGLSYHRLSHLFSEQMGLSLRSYQTWLKLDQVWRLIERGCSVPQIAKEAGFGTVNHLSNTFHGAYGVSLVSHLRNIDISMSFEKV